MLRKNVITLNGEYYHFKGPSWPFSLPSIRILLSIIQNLLSMTVMSSVPIDFYLHVFKLEYQKELSAQQQLFNALK